MAPIRARATWSSIRDPAATPRKATRLLPAGSTPIDFAYHVHTEIGHHCRGARVNGKMVSLEHRLRTGDQVEIVTTRSGGPSRDWLNPHLGLVKSQIVHGVPLSATGTNIFFDRQPRK